MSFTFPCDPQYMLHERTPQFLNLGVPAEALETVRLRIDDMWRDGPGGWAFEWSRLAEEAEVRGSDLEASILFGVARFPCFANDSHRRAHDRQRIAYVRALSRPNDALHFERRTVNVAYRQGTTPVVVHLLMLPELAPNAPLLLFMGGVDTWKMDVHHSALVFGRLVGANLALIDMPGTGESQVKLAHDADEILRNTLAAIRSPGQRVGCLAFSYSGLWATKLALSGALDAAVAIGAPIDRTFARDNITAMPNGMDAIMGNALGFDAHPDLATLAPILETFSLRRQGLLDSWTSRTPLYIINGVKDPYVPESDVTVFQDRPETVVRLVEDATHCAPEKMHDLAPELGSWLRHRLEETV